jgi:hypothetical protein
MLKYSLDRPLSGQRPSYLGSDPTLNICIYLYAKRYRPAPSPYSSYGYAVAGICVETEL